MENAYQKFTLATTTTTAVMVVMKIIALHGDKLNNAMLMGLESHIMIKIARHRFWVARQDFVNVGVVVNGEKDADVGILQHAMMLVTEIVVQPQVFPVYFHLHTIR
jgi:hypothetical protein